MLNLLKTLSSYPSIHHLVTKGFQAIAQTILATPLNQIVLVGGGVVDCPSCVETLDELIGMSQQVVGTDQNDILTSFQDPGRETRPDYFLGYGGQDIFVLGDSQQAYYLESPEATAIIADLEVGADQIQLHGSSVEYSLGISESQTDTVIIHNETEQIVGWLLGVTNVALDDASVFSFV
ncbi:MAG: hypothetical protein QNJ72_45585 [Pleurocapsa sp. MO_226.B13]|nr:hypothetical protein [Pleurocapsa sp. MO_226.B13]